MEEGVGLFLKLYHAQVARQAPIPINTDSIQDAVVETGMQVAQKFSDATEQVKNNVPLLIPQGK